MRLIDKNWVKREFCAMLFPRGRSDVLRVIDKAPIIEAEPVRHGRWRKGKVAFMLMCSECGCCVDWSRDYNFCPNCGAKMTGGTGNDR